MRKPLICAAAIFALTTAGCGKTEIDAKKAEKFVASQFAPRPNSVDCPSGVEAKKGRTLKCKLESPTGKRYEVTLRILDEKGRVTLVEGGGRELP